MKKAAVRTLVLLLVSCVVFCGTFTGAKAGEAPSSPDWRDLRGSKVYGQFNPDGAPDGFMVMEAKSETCYGLMDHQVTGKNGWDGTCVYFKRDNSGAVESLAVLECEDGWIAKALTFSLNGDITFMDLATSCGLRFENKDGQYTVAEQASSTGWGSKQKISRDEIPVWVEDIFYTGVSVRVEEEKDGLLHYGSYTVDAVTETGEPVSLLAVQAEKDGSVSIRWKEKQWSYDAVHNEFHPSPDDSAAWAVETPEDLRRCLQAADAGDARAQYAAGAAYLDGKVVDQSYGEALKYFTLAAEQENGDALCALAKMYMNGTGVEKSDAEAARYLARAANLENAEALYLVGSISYQDKGSEESMRRALDAFSRSAKQLYPEALCRMAKLYETGELVKKNAWLSKLCYIAAAKRGADEAQYTVGMMYYDGKGVYQSEREALPYLERAADLGNVNAQYYTAISYYFGHGSMGYGAEANKKAAYYFGLAADQGDMFSQTWLGDLYLYGKGVEQSYMQAEHYYRLAADQGYGYAAEALGDLYSNENSGLLDLDAAVRYYELAVELGQKKAQSKLDALRQR